MLSGHSYRCDYALTPGDPDNECYCPTAEERAEQLRYDTAVAEGDPPEPCWVTVGDPALVMDSIEASADA